MWNTKQTGRGASVSCDMLFDAIPQLVWTTGPDGLHDYINQHRRDYTGLTLEQLQRDRWAYLQSVHPADQESSRAHWQHALETGALYEHEQRMRQGTTGEYRWFLVRRRASA
ncbi:hypothetical protein KSZ_51960 [Dictyobacter formicarum]|uniref:PAS domain-containing protein n=1 Tax=Dictyobacter formicarum TaxID=2778368 RepID=A0ABQ3VM63_9CHLR|nr:hypothetical protein KSZ_51960 [Dictyobacter formicarum]